MVLARLNVDAHQINQFQDFLGDGVGKILRLHYLICVLLPILKQINIEMHVEIETEAMVKGSSRFNCWCYINQFCFKSECVICLQFPLMNFFYATGIELSEVDIKQDEFGGLEHCWYAASYP